MDGDDDNDANEDKQDLDGNNDNDENENDNSNNDVKYLDGNDDDDDSDEDLDNDGDVNGNVVADGDGDGHFGVNGGSEGGEKSTKIATEKGERITVNVSTFIKVKLSGVSQSKIIEVLCRRERVNQFRHSRNFLE